MIKGFLWFLIVCCLSSRGLAQTSSPSPPPSERWEMELGSSRELEVPPGSVLRLSQKRTLEIEELGKNRFRLLALRAGHVYLRALSPDQRLLASWVVEVQPAAKGGQRERVLEESWEALFCGESGIICDRQRRLVRGESDSPSWLHAARRQCEKEHPCRFDVFLSEAAQSEWQTQLRSEFARVDLILGRDGFAQIERDCATLPPPHEESLVKQLQSRFGIPLLFRCRPPLVQSYRLEWLAVAQRRHDAQRDNPLRWEGLAIPADVPLRAIVQGLSERGEAQIIAQPIVQLLLGAESSIADGLEIETQIVSEGRASSSWKSVGFKLESQLLAEQGGQARLKVSMSLSRPRGERQTLDSSQLQTELWLSFGQWQLLGRIQTRSETDDAARLPWFSQLPLIGPLFTWTTIQDAQSEISLFARIALSDGAETPPPLDWQ